MPPDQYIPLISAIISFGGLLLVVLQLRDSTQQRRIESLVEIYDINRQLLSLGFDHPVLFKVLEDAKAIDDTRQRRYLQLWFNQFSLIHAYFASSRFNREVKESMERDLSDFMTMHNAQHHWRKHGAFYPVSFQKMVNGMIKKNEPHKAAHAMAK